jgi:subtilisin family serine protease
MKSLLSPAWLEQAKEGGSAAGQGTTAAQPSPLPASATSDTSGGALGSAGEPTLAVAPGAERSGRPAFGPGAGSDGSGTRNPEAALAAEPTAEPTGSGSGPQTAQPPSETQTFIVFLDSAPGNGGVAERARALLASLGEAGQPSMLFEQLHGFAIQVTAQQAQRLRGLGGVKSIEAEHVFALERPINVVKTPNLPPRDDLTGSALTTYGDLQFSTGEYMPWGVSAVWQGRDIAAKGNIAGDTFAFVIDSGVRSTTGDLNLDPTSDWHRSWITGESPFSDGQGHGTHVAATIAALANGSGVVGVAPGANVVSLKVFNSSGGGATNTTIIAAINHAVAIINTNSLNKSKVVINMSLGGSFNSSIDTAVRNAAAQGIRFAIAAGNSGQDADSFSPASAGDHANVFTVSAVDSAYKMPRFSNWDDTRGGDDVDVAAPGVRVLSHYTEGYLAWLDGTSMASPHAAGLLLMGGITPGDRVTPFNSRPADPFALGSNFPA